MADWDINNPGDDDFVDQYPTNERAHRAAVKANFGVEHHDTDDADIGKHKLVTFLAVLGGDPTLGAAEAAMYTLDDAGTTRVYIKVGTASRQELPFEKGTRMLFHQTAAPTGWSKETNAAYNNTALRVTTGTVGSQTAQQTFSTVFGKTATDAHTLTIAQMPLHGHKFRAFFANQNTAQSRTTGGMIVYPGGTYGPHTGAPSDAQGQQIGGEGGGQGHSHNMDMRLNYHDVIIAVKD